MSTILARLRISHALTAEVFEYADDTLGDETLERIRQATDGGIEVGEMTIVLASTSLLGAQRKRDVPSGRHRAAVETSTDEGATWSAIIEGTALYEDVSHGRRYADGTRDWTLVVRDDALDRAWDALGALDLQDVAEAMVTAASGYEEVAGARMESDPPAPVSQISRWWRLADTVATSITEAGLVVTGPLPEAFPHQVLWFDGEPARLHSEAPVVVFGRPHLVGAPEALHGPHPTMPQWTAAELLNLWMEHQQLGMSASYGAFPSAHVSVSLRDPWRREDPDAPLALPAIDDVVLDDWDWETEAGQLDGEPVGDFAIEYDGGVDGSALDGAALQTPARGSYAASRVALGGEAPERETLNETGIVFDWRLCSLADDVTLTRSLASGYAEDVTHGRPAYSVQEAYRPAEGQTAQQDGEGDIVRLVSLLDVSGDWRAIYERTPAAPATGERTASMELWAIDLFRRFALAYGDLDVVRASLPLETLPSVLQLLELSGGLSFDALSWAVRSVREDHDAETAEIELVRPSGGWAAEPAPDDGVAGVPEEVPSLTGYLDSSLTTDDQGQTTYYLYTAAFVASVPEDSATPVSVEWEFDPARSFSVDAEPRRATATTTDAGNEGEPEEDPHPLAGQQARVRAIYRSGPTAWTPWVTAT